MTAPRSVLVIQTAFPGDVVLTLPMMQALRARLPEARLAFVAIPSAANLLEHHPAVDEIIRYDKKGKESGPGGFIRLVSHLRRFRFDAAVVPHRSLRSALLARLAGIPFRVAFDTSAGRGLFTATVRYRRDLHEVERNLRLLEPLLGEIPERQLPCLYPSADDGERVDRFLREQNSEPLRFPTGRMVAVAPGSVWRTKRWPEERFTDVCSLLMERGFGVVLIGGPDDHALCTCIETKLHDRRVLNAAGKLTLLQSAELIGRCEALVANDSAPMHLAVAMQTPVIAIFGATVPEFGFAPLGPCDRVVQTTGLPCRPCSIHGGQSCPIGTFDCMVKITPPRVVEVLHEVLARAAANA